MAENNTPKQPVAEKGFVANTLSWLTETKKTIGGYIESWNDDPGRATINKIKKDKIIGDITTRYVDAKIHESQLPARIAVLEAQEEKISFDKNPRQEAAELRTLRSQLQAHRKTIKGYKADVNDRVKSLAGNIESRALETSVINGAVNEIIGFGEKVANEAVKRMKEQQSPKAPPANLNPGSTPLQESASKKTVPAKQSVER